LGNTYDKKIGQTMVCCWNSWYASTKGMKND
jgi:hypothetical protein